MQVDHQLFTVEKVDVTGDGNEEILVCAWDGWTYFINHNKQSVRFQFEEPVSAFCAGPFGSSGSPALIYATFSNKVYVYHNVELYQIPTKTLEDVVPPSTLALAPFLLYEFPLWKKQKELEASMSSLTLSSNTTKEEKEEEKSDDSTQERWSLLLSFMRHCFDFPVMNSLIENLCHTGVGVLCWDADLEI